MALPPSKPNPLHGKLPPEPTKEVSMPGAGPEPNMAVAEPAVNVAMTEATQAEMEAGRKALSSQNDRLNAEQEAGRHIVSRYPQPKPVTQPE